MLPSGFLVHTSERVRAGPRRLSRVDHVDHDTVPSSKPARVVKQGRMCTCQWYQRRTVGSGVEDDVVGHVPEALVDRTEGAAHGSPTPRCPRGCRWR